MRDLTLTNIAAACGGSLLANGLDPEREITFITTDSREAGPGCLFIAIAGERSDGHDFIAAAAAQGAACCLCERVPDGTRCAAVVVKSTITAAGDLAAFYRSRFAIPVIGITGSVGKTTAKEMVSAVLAQRFNVLKTQGNFNNELGVPLTLFRLRGEHEVAVVEMGISHFGEMRRLAEIVRPDLALYTVIGHSHLEYLGDRKGVLRAKAEMLDYVAPDGAVFVNGDDDLLCGLTCRQRTVRFGTAPDCEVRAENVRSIGLDGTSCDIIACGRVIPVTIPAYGMHMVTAALEGAAVGLYLGLSDAEIQAGIAAYEPTGRRSRITETGFCRIIDDCYNANPTSTASAILSLQAAASGRKVCILGDMLELGEDSRALHYRTGSIAAACGIAMVLCCGEAARAIYEGARESASAPLTWYFPDKEELLAALPHLIQAGDTVLVKASRGMRFEDIVDALKELQP